MQNNNTMVVQLTVDQLQELISKAVVLGLQKHQDSIVTKKEIESDELLTREQVSNLLKVSYPTLWSWNEKDILKNKKIGNRVYYEKADVMNQLRKN